MGETIDWTAARIKSARSELASALDRLRAKYRPLDVAMIVRNVDEADRLLDLALRAHDDRARCHDVAKANARRIVACVNALAGIDTESLEQGEVNVMITKKAK